MTCPSLSPAARRAVGAAILMQCGFNQAGLLLAVPACKPSMSNDLFLIDKKRKVNQLHKSEGIVKGILCCETNGDTIASAYIFACCIVNLTNLMSYHEIVRNAKLGSNVDLIEH